MSASIRQSSAPKPPLPIPHGQQESPPFWELEDLIASGFDRNTALTILAARRERRDGRPCLPPPGAPAIMILEEMSDIGL